MKSGVEEDWRWCEEATDPDSEDLADGSPGLSWFLNRFNNELVSVRGNAAEREGAGEAEEEGEEGGEAADDDGVREDPVWGEDLGECDGASKQHETQIRHGQVPFN